MKNNAIKSAASAAFVLFGLLLLATLPGCDHALPSSGNHLDMDPATKPYSLVTIHNTKLDPRRNLPLGYALGDIDGDGVLERIEGNSQKFLGYDSVGGSAIKPRWEIHLPDDLFLDDELNRFGVCHDITGDKVDEVFLVATNQNHGQWRLLGLDVIEQEFFLDMELPLGEDRRRPTGWDGVWAVVGWLDSAGPGAGPALLLMHRSGYDGTYRGFCAVSPTTGEFFWDFVSGAQPNTSSVKIDDLDGDGQQEICWATTAPDNWGGRRINGLSDDVAYVFVLNNQGQLMFKHQVAVLFSGGGLQTWDLTGDGVKELVVATENGATGGNSQLVIFDWARETVLASQRRVAGFRGLAMAPGPRPGSFWLYSGSSSGSVSRFLFQDGKLTQDFQLLTDEDRVTVLGQADFLPPAGKEIVVNVGNQGQVVLLSPGMRELAVLPGEEFGDKTAVDLLPVLPDRPQLILSSSAGQWALEYQKNPRRYMVMARQLGVVLLMVGLLGGAFLLGLRLGRGRGDGVPGTGPAPTSEARARVQANRQALYSLHRELSDINHQVVGKAKGLQRLVWLMDAYTTDMGDRQAMEQRIRQVALDFKDTVHPSLISLLNQADAAEFEGDKVAGIRAVLLSLARRVEGLVETGLEPALVAAQQADLKDEWARVEAGLLALRAAVNAFLTTDPVRMFQGLVLIRTEEIQRLGIEARFEGLPAGAPGLLARIDGSDLRFVLENLLDNALSAMEGVTEGRLQIKVERDEREIVLSISDNGVGIEPALQEEIFNRRFSSHPGGGHGLFRTREILAKWGGEISLAGSEPGQGTTFIVKLLAAGDGLKLRSQEAEA